MASYHDGLCSRHVSALFEIAECIGLLTLSMSLLSFFLEVKRFSEIDGGITEHDGPGIAVGIDEPGIAVGKVDVVVADEVNDLTRLAWGIVVGTTDDNPDMS